MEFSILLTALLSGLPALALTTATATDRSAYEAHIFKGKEGTLPYRLLRPEGYEPGKKYPMVLFLHGAGERGNDNRQQLRVAGDYFANPATRKRFPAWVLVPQCPDTDFWAPGQLHLPNSWPGRIDFEFYGKTSPMRPVMELTTQLLNTFLNSGDVDDERVYLAGVSLGAMGTFDLLSRKTDLFAAAIAICGGGHTGSVSSYAKGFPIWVFHGSADPLVNVDYSRKMVKALKDQGAQVRYSEYPGVGHQSWNKALAEPELLPWLFGQKRHSV